MLIAFLRNSNETLCSNADARNFTSKDVEPFKEYIEQRFGKSAYFEKLLGELVDSWSKKNDRLGNLTYSTLLGKVSESINIKDNIWLVMNSLRDVDTETYYRIKDFQAS